MGTCESDEHSGSCLQCARQIRELRLQGIPLVCIEAHASLPWEQFPILQGEDAFKVGEACHPNASFDV